MPLRNTDMNQEYLPETRRETIHGGSTPASMRVTVSGKYSQSTTVFLNGITIISSRFHVGKY